MKQLHKSSERKCYNKLKQRKCWKQRASDFEKKLKQRKKKKARNSKTRNDQRPRAKEKAKLKEKTRTRPVVSKQTNKQQKIKTLKKKDLENLKLQSRIQHERIHQIPEHKDTE